MSAGPPPTDAEIDAALNARSSRWTDEDRERAATPEPAMPAAEPEGPPFGPQFRPGTLFHANGWWCRVLGYAHGHQDNQWGMIVVPERPSHRGKRRARRK